MTTRSRRDDEVTNNVLRKQFNDWYEITNRPNLRLVSKDIGLNYYTFVSWKTGKHQYSFESLRKVRDYFTKLHQRQQNEINDMYIKIINSLQ